VAHIRDKLKLPTSMIEVGSTCHTWASTGDAATVVHKHRPSQISPTKLHGC
jgi:hypothetical protein